MLEPLPKHVRSEPNAHLRRLACWITVVASLSVATLVPAVAEGPRAYVSGLVNFSEVIGDYGWLPLLGWRDQNLASALPVPPGASAARWAWCGALGVTAIFLLLAVRWKSQGGRYRMIGGSFAVTSLLLLGSLAWFTQGRMAVTAYSSTLPIVAELPAPDFQSQTPQIILGMPIVVGCTGAWCGYRAYPWGCSVDDHLVKERPVLLRFDRAHGMFLFDDRHSQLAFRKVDARCVHPRYVHVADVTRPPSGMLAFSGILLAAALWINFGLGKSLGLGRLTVVMALCFSALFPLAPGIASLW